MSGIPTSTTNVFLDTFRDTALPGRVVGSAGPLGLTRSGTDAEGVLSIDHGALRIKPLLAPGWDRAAVRYSPRPIEPGSVLSAVVTNGRNASTNATPWPAWHHWLQQWLRGTQCDPPPTRLARWPKFPRRDTVRRRLATARHDASLSEADRSAFSLAFGWVADPADPFAGVVIAARATPSASSELCLVVGGEVTVLGSLLELPMRMALAATRDEIVALAAADDGTIPMEQIIELGRCPLPPTHAEEQWSPTVDQRVVGEKGFAADTRVREVRLDAFDHEALVAELAATSSLTVPTAVAPLTALASSGPGVMLVHDDFVGHQQSSHRADGSDADGSDADGSDVDGSDSGSLRAGSPDLAGRVVQLPSGGALAWRQVVGTRALLQTADGVLVGPEVEVPTSKLARLIRPSGQRTVYVLDQPMESGWIETTLTVPDTEPRTAQRGRGGLVLYQDDDNYVLINDWVDAAHAASVSVFWRTNGFEDVYDGLWVIVEDRLEWGREHTLRVTFDAGAFTVWLDGAAVLAREFAQLYPNAAALQVRAVGLCANWDFGDDTGSMFSSFTAHSSHPPRTR